MPILSRRRYSRFCRSSRDVVLKSVCPVSKCRNPCRKAFLTPVLRLSTGQGHHSPRPSPPFGHADRRQQAPRFRPAVPAQITPVLPQQMKVAQLMGNLPSIDHFQTGRDGPVPIAHHVNRRRGPLLPRLVNSRLPTGESRQSHPLFIPDHLHFHPARRRPRPQPIQLPTPGPTTAAGPPAHASTTGIAYFLPPPPNRWPPRNSAPTPPASGRSRRFF